MQQIRARLGVIRLEMTRPGTTLVTELHRNAAISIIRKNMGALDDEERSEAATLVNNIGFSNECKERILEALVPMRQRTPRKQQDWKAFILHHPNQVDANIGSIGFGR